MLVDFWYLLQFSQLLTEMRVMCIEISNSVLFIEAPFPFRLITLFLLTAVSEATDDEHSNEKSGGKRANVQKPVGMADRLSEGFYSLI